MLFCLPVQAENADKQWNWYYAAFYSPSLKSKVLLRSGVATVDIVHSKVLIKFKEEISPDIQSYYAGKVSASGEVLGSLNEFFPSGKEEFHGKYKQFRSSTTCHWQEIVLKPTTPDGSVIVISRIDGKCQ